MLAKKIGYEHLRIIKISLYKNKRLKRWIEKDSNGIENNKQKARSSKMLDQRSITQSPRESSIRPASIRKKLRFLNEY